MGDESEEANTRRRNKNREREEGRQRRREGGDEGREKVGDEGEKIEGKRLTERCGGRRGREKAGEGGEKRRKCEEEAEVEEEEVGGRRGCKQHELDIKVRRFVFVEINEIP